MCVASALALSHLLWASAHLPATATSPHTHHFKQDLYCIYYDHRQGTFCHTVKSSVLYWHIIYVTGFTHSIWHCAITVQSPSCDGIYVLFRVNCIWSRRDAIWIFNFLLTITTRNNEHIFMCLPLLTLSAQCTWNNLDLRNIHQPVYCKTYWL